MNLNLFGNQVKLLNSTADITEWSDDAGAGKTFGALVKAASIQGTALYVTPHASWHFFKRLPDFITDNFNMSVVNLSASNEATKIFFVRPTSFEDNFIGRRAKLIIFDECEPSNEQLEKILAKGSAMVVVGRGVPIYRETSFTRQTNHYLT